MTFAADLSAMTIFIFADRFESAIAPFDHRCWKIFCHLWQGRFLLWYLHLSFMWRPGQIQCEFCFAPNLDSEMTAPFYLCAGPGACFANFYLLTIEIRRHQRIAFVFDCFDHILPRRTWHTAATTSFSNRWKINTVGRCDPGFAWSAVAHCVSSRRNCDAVWIISIFNL